MIRTVLYCDLDTDKQRKAETVTFSIDGEDYETELCPAHKHALEKITGELIPYARKANARRQVRAASNGHRSARDRSLSKTIRAWCVANDVEIKTHGRIPVDIIALYEMRNGAG